MELLFNSSCWFLSLCLCNLGYVTSLRASPGLWFAHASVTAFPLETSAHFAVLCCVATSKVNLQSECAEADREAFGRSARSSVLILMERIGVRERVGTAHYSLFNAQLSCNGNSHLSWCLLRDKCKH